MRQKLLVEFHCHSCLSDGELPPGRLALLLADRGVRLAALTDHNTARGCAEFNAVLLQKGVDSMYGAEISARFLSRELHILAYGFKLVHGGLEACMINAGINTLSGSIDKLYEAGRVIGMVHEAGGAAFLAHPMLYHRSEIDFNVLIKTLKAKGLDGMECFYSGYDAKTVQYLAGIAARYDLIVSGGTDFHRETEIVGPDNSAIARKELKRYEPGLNIEQDFVRRFWNHCNRGG